MSLKKLVCLWLVVIGGAFGGLTAPQAIAQGHGVSQAGAQGAELTEADMNEVKALLKTSMLPALMAMQEGLTLITLDPEGACRAGKAADAKLLELSRGLISIRDRVKAEGRDATQIQALLDKTAVMLTDGKRPGDIFCNKNLKPSELSPEDRAIMTKISAYVSGYTRQMTSALQAALDGNTPQACTYFQDTKKTLLELDAYLAELRAAKLKANQDYTQYDRLIITNATNQRQVDQLIQQTCPAA